MQCLASIIQHCSAFRKRYKELATSRSETARHVHALLQQTLGGGTTEEHSSVGLINSLLKDDIFNRSGQAGNRMYNFVDNTEGKKLSPDQQSAMDLFGRILSVIACPRMRREWFATSPPEFAIQTSRWKKNGLKKNEDNPGPGIPENSTTEEIYEVSLSGEHTTVQKALNYSWQNEDGVEFQSVAEKFPRCLQVRNADLTDWKCSPHLNIEQCGAKAKLAYECVAIMVYHTHGDVEGLRKDLGSRGGHYTSVVYRGNRWVWINDDKVYDINFKWSDFRERQLSKISMR